MGEECLKVVVGSPWLDTVDQEHIPLKVSNLCDEELSVELEALTPQGGSLQRFSLRLPGSTTRELEVVTDLYLQGISIRGRWRKNGGEWREMEEIYVSLR
ncbi:MAG: hypothetical protein BA066_06340 [Candidatus Korarchaeota archaeon NZ13-K]|nr:MAG: hypothetical protein BA066_06340 [Candidatus Korarchaeota archaeon NZ13-K]